MSLQPQQQQQQTYTVALSDNEWSQMLQSNQEAQDLLSNAIAHHQEHYRAGEDTSKRTINHLHHKSDHYSDPKNDGTQLSEGDSSDEAAGDGKPAPKKAGRKPLTTEPTNKRKAQNRAAQRAFRERKEKYVKSLEDRIKELEEMNPSRADSKLAEENMNLKVLVQKLETENYFLKEQSFTFDFPISQPGLYNVAKAQRDAATAAAVGTVAQNEGTTTPSSIPTPTPSLISSSLNNTPPYAPTSNPISKLIAQGTLGTSNGAKPTSGNDSLIWTPPSSGGDSVPNSPLNHDLPTPEQDSISQVSFSDNAGVVPRFRNGTPDDMALFSSLLDGATTAYSNPIANVGPLSNSTSVSNSHPSIPSTSFNGTHSPVAVSPIDNNLQVNNGNITANTVFGSASNLVPRSSPLGNTLHSRLESSASPSSTLALFSENSPSPSLDDLVNTPLFETDKDGNVRFTPPASMSGSSLTFEQTQALFTDFRDPSDSRDFFTGFDEPIETTYPENTMGSLFNDQLLDYTQLGLGKDIGIDQVTNQAVDKVASQVPNQNPCQSHGAEGAVPSGYRHPLPPVDDNETAIPCPQAWEHIAKHPNFDDADIDELCAELKSKAKCSGHGPVIALSDVDKLMNKLD
ncbi:DNA-binding transcription factor yap1 [Haplosporangium sp. Z 767]|nr:DNA-binding transcription factor yap1 [Haplosporangium sp. Z 767]KAF9191953.1 DNA-binding transcription factor yap1 [Haplosporangium sp. Z 11]